MVSHGVIGERAEKEFVEEDGDEGVEEIGWVVVCRVEEDVGDAPRKGRVLGTEGICDEGLAGVDDRDVVAAREGKHLRIGAVALGVKKPRSRRGLAIGDWRGAVELLSRRRGDIVDEAEDEEDDGGLLRQVEKLQDQPLELGLVVA